MSLVSANKTETNTYAVEIAIAAEDFRAAIQQAYLKQRKSIQIPGFRKGKAPLQMIEKLYGKEVFFEDALEIVFPEAVQAAYEDMKANIEKARLLTEELYNLRRIVNHIGNAPNSEPHFSYMSRNDHAEILHMSYKLNYRFLPIIKERISEIEEEMKTL